MALGVCPQKQGTSYFLSEPPPLLRPRASHGQRGRRPAPRPALAGVSLFWLPGEFHVSPRACACTPSLRLHLPLQYLGVNTVECASQAPNCRCVSPALPHRHRPAATKRGAAQSQVSAAACPGAPTPLRRAWEQCSVPDVIKQQTQPGANSQRGLGVLCGETQPNKSHSKQLMAARVFRNFL